MHCFSVGVVVARCLFSSVWPDIQSIKFTFLDQFCHFLTSSDQVEGLNWNPEYQGWNCNASHSFH